MIIGYVKGPLLSSLEDRSSYVRRTAVIGSAKFYKLAPNEFEGMIILCEIFLKKFSFCQDIKGRFINLNSLMT